MPVNQLLNGADPIIAASRAHRITPAAAAARTGLWSSGSLLS